MKDENVIEDDLSRLQRNMMAMGMPLSSRQIDDFKRYVDLLLEWNRSINLISRQDEHNVVTKHIFESLSLLDAVPISSGATIIDVGTGAGLPGIHLKIVRSDLKLSLLDSRRKKVLFLENVVRELNLQEVSIIPGRVEEISQDSGHRNRYDMIISRAVAELTPLFTWSYALLRPQGTFIAIKGGDMTAEIKRFRDKYPSHRIEEIHVMSRLVPPERDLSIIKICTA